METYSELFKGVVKILLAIGALMGFSYILNPTREIDLQQLLIYFSAWIIPIIFKVMEFKRRLIVLRLKKSNLTQEELEAIALNLKSYFSRSTITWAAYAKKIKGEDCVMVFIDKKYKERKEIISKDLKHIIPSHSVII